MSETENTEKTEADTSVPLQNFSGDVKAVNSGDDGEPEGGLLVRTAADLETVFDVPVKVTAVLGKTQMSVGELMKLETGEVLQLDRKVGEAIDIFVNNKLIARGEVVLVDQKLGVTMTEIIQAE